MEYQRKINKAKATHVKSQLEWLEKKFSLARVSHKG